MKVDDINKTIVKDSEISDEEMKQDEPNQSKLKYVIMILGCLLMFGNNYSFDNPQALQKQLTQDLDISISNYNLLYSAFSFPNIFLTLIGGFIIDFLGVRFGIILFSAIVVVAQTIVALGGAFKIFWIMLVGRIIFGCASENLVIAQAAIICKWFRGKELSTAIGYIMTVPELASAANSFLTPMLYESYQGLTYPLFFSVILCIFSFVCAVVLCILDKKNELNKLKGQFIIEEQEEEEGEEGEQQKDDIERVSFKDIKNLNGTFWILVLICTLTLGSYTPFLDDANDFLQEKFEFTNVQAGKVLTIPYLMAAITSPFFGPYIDKVGKRRKFILITCVLFTLTHFTFGMMPNGQHGQPNWFSVIPLMFLGSSYALYSCVLIPSIQYIVAEKVVGTAFGLLGMFESVALAFFPIIAGYIVEISEDPQQGYSNVGLFFSGISLFGIIFTLSLYFFDKKSSMILDFVHPEDPSDLEKKMLRTTKSESSSDEEDDDSSDEDSDDDQFKKKKVCKSYSSLKSKKLLTSPQLRTRTFLSLQLSVYSKNLRENLLVGQTKRFNIEKNDENMIYVHLIPHSHDDVGWLKTYEEYYYGLNNKVQWAGIQYTIDSVVRSLFFDQTKKFIQVEIAFFKLWWDEQNDDVRNKTKYLIKNGQLEFINGGWCMNDEATAYYEDIIDQMTLGHQWILDRFQIKPTIGWQLDPFGHTSAQAELFALMGFDAWFFSRIDYQDMNLRKQQQKMELISIVDQYSIFTHINYNHYEAPPQFSFDSLHSQDPIVDNQNSIHYNVDKRAEVLVDYFKSQHQSYIGNILMHTLGTDFGWSNAQMYYTNIDRLIKYINSNKQKYNMQIMYSTPSQYLQAINQLNQQYPTKTDDFMPYADRPNAYWTGYFTSRVSLKLLIKQLGRFAQIQRRFVSTLLLNGKSQYIQVNRQQIIDAQQILDQALATNQHHDAVTGTAKQHVTNDYIEMLCNGHHKISQQLYQIMKELIEFEIQDETSQIVFEECNFNQTASSCQLVYEQLKNGNAVQINMIDNKNIPLQDYVRIKVPKLNLIIYDQTNKIINGDIICINNDDDCELYFIYNRNPKQIIEYFRILPNQENPSAIIIQPQQESLKYNSSQDYISLNNSKQFKLTYKYYISSEDKQYSGAYIFRPNDDSIEFGEIKNHKLYIGRLIQIFYIERDQVYTKIKKLQHIDDTYEIESYITDIPIQKENGKEVVMIISTDIQNDDTFYTDSSGMRMQQRKLNYRPTWDLEVNQPIAGNYYPVNGILQIQNNQTGEVAAILNDRSQGGTSLHSGELELMIHRRLLKDDARGVGEPLNEKQSNGRGLNQNFQHTLTFFNKNNLPNQARQLQYLQDLKPILIFSNCKNEVFPQPVKSFKITYPRDLEKMFTPNGQAITKFYLQTIGVDQYIYRIHNLGEEGTFQVPELDQFQIVETTLTGNQLWTEWLDKKLNWKVQEGLQQPKDQPVHNETVLPQQLRTFRLTKKSNSNQ
ncbi:unnamed protein product [Paramecium primaurelia]|uniref:alpha-mannosidase n=1 Tax=Paramecium primaurelia TaxID=5886 RepID=A0A8S1MYT0_PARPR|nr:unnamed protein product [Paramecium primaurelia]